MKISVIGCGQSAKHWDGSGPSIGVNDVFKFGYHPTYLLLLNAPSRFTTERLSNIIKTNPHRVYSDMAAMWRKHFSCEIKDVDSQLWSNPKKISKNYNYHSKTSPFAAISMAYSWGFTEIVLYGVDFIDHKNYNPSKKEFRNEFNNYKSFCEKLREQNVFVYRINEESNLNFLPIWNPSV